jgi:hypothetical protein
VEKEIILINEKKNGKIIFAEKEKIIDTVP